MKRKRKLIAIVLSGLFLAYFSASFIFVPRAPGLQDQDTSLVKLENNEGAHSQNVLRSASEQTEDAVKFFDDFTTIACLESFHTVSQQNRLESLASSHFGTYDIYLSIRRLQI